jgi:ribonuclease T1
MFAKNLKRFFVALMLTAGAAAAFAFSNDVALSELPKQAQSTYALIQQGGPFPYEKDGVVFGNRERQLPQQKRGYYREYTVKTPATKNRGPTMPLLNESCPKKNNEYHDHPPRASQRPTA